MYKGSWFFETRMMEALAIEDIESKIINKV